MLYNVKPSIFEIENNCLPKKLLWDGEYSNIIKMIVIIFLQLQKTSNDNNH